MTFRMVAGLSARVRMREMVREPTGSPVSMYERTTECRIARSLADSSLPDNSILSLTILYLSLTTLLSVWGGPRGPRAPPGRPCAGPLILAGNPNKPRAHRIPLNVVADLIELGAV